MGSLATTYAKDLGVKVGNKPIFFPHFYPLPCRNYIVVHNSKKVEAKFYKHFPEVIRLLKNSPHFNRNNIKIVQIGAFGEERIEGVDFHYPTATLKQCAFLIKNSLGLCGIDSVPGHIASALDIPIVNLYGHTWANSCKPIWNKNSGAIQLESHRNNNKPSFSLQESPQTIDMIFPEEVVQAMFDVMGVEESPKEKTHYIGDRYNVERVDVIPEKPFFTHKNNMNIRMDLMHNEPVLLDILRGQNGLVEITTKKPFNVDFLPSNKIRMINYLADSFDENFVRAMKKVGREFIILCTNKNNLPDERLKLFEFPVIDYDENQEAENRKNNSGLDSVEGLSVQTRKKVVCGDVTYNTLAEYTGNKMHFWLDLDWYRVYSKL